MEPLAKVFGSPGRLKLLRLFLYNRGSAFSATQIVERSGLTKEVVRREVADLLAAGLIRKKALKGGAGYQIDPRFEELAALERFIRETTNLRPERVLAAVKRAGTLRLVALSGIFTGALEPQIDLLIVGDNLSDRVIAHAVRSLEADLGREIRYAAFPTADFRYRLGVYDRLLRDVFDYPHRLLLDRIGLK